MAIANGSGTVEETRKALVMKLGEKPLRAPFRALRDFHRQAGELICTATRSV